MYLSWKIIFQSNIFYFELKSKVGMTANSSVIYQSIILVKITKSSEKRSNGLPVRVGCWGCFRCDDRSRRAEKGYTCCPGSPRRKPDRTFPPRCDGTRWGSHSRWPLLSPRSPVVLSKSAQSQNRTVIDTRISDFRHA